MELVAPRYGAGTLSDVVPSVLAGMEVPGMLNVLDLPASPKVCVLLVDGMGWRLLQAHADTAPFLASLAADQEAITAGFPTTTATSISAIGTGLTPGEHGLVGLSFAVSDDELINVLGWSRQGVRRVVDLRDKVVPEQVQPRPTAFERARDAGVTVSLAVPRYHRGSGLTRAVLRGGDLHGVHALGDLAATARQALRSDGRVFCYAYHADLDLLGHVYGPGSEPWRMQLHQVDQLVSSIAEALPPDGLLVVTADHGMVPVTEDDRVDFDTCPDLQAGVRLLGGEARVRYVYTEPGAVDDVRQAWQSVLGDRATIRSRDEVIDAGWYGPGVAGYVRARVGDLVVVAHDNTAIIRSEMESRVSGFVGHHGALTADEQLVPLLLHQNTAAGLA